MRLVLYLMLIVLTVVSIGFAITNPEHVTVTIGNTQYSDVWLPFVAAVALAFGAGVASVVALTEGATIRLANRRLRREIRRLETENGFLRAQPQTDVDFRDGAAALPEHGDESSPAHTAAAPVYDPNLRDPRAD
jgi:uncharacterized membrane protein YciS (DUF1049 family)